MSSLIEKDTHTVASFYTRSLLDAVTTMGHDGQKLAQQLGLDISTVNDPDSRIPLSIQTKLWEHVILTTNDPYIGLPIGELTTIGRWGLIEYLAMNSNTFRGLISDCVHYWRLVTDDDKVIQLEELGDKAIISFTSVNCHIYQAYEADVVYAMRLLKLIISPNFAPLEIQFMHLAPDDLSEHQRVLQCPLKFEQKTNGFVIPSMLLDIPLATDNTPLHSILNDQAKQVLLKLDQHHSFAKKVALILINQPLDVTIDKVASQLNMSPRTLQRKLKEEDEGFQPLLDNVRREKARLYLQDKQMTLTEITYMLGYAEFNALNLAVKLWFKKTPSQFRKDYRESFAA